MALKIGIIGLPNVGKSTLFQALTKKQVDISSYPFCTLEPNIGLALVPDERLEKIAQAAGSEKIIPAVIEVVDIAGLVKNAHKGAGLGNQFLHHIREVDAVIEVVRTFENSEIAHFEETINPQRDMEIIAEELRLKDEESKEQVNLLTKKPIIYFFNGPLPEVKPPAGGLTSGTSENRIAGDLKTKKNLDDLIKKSYEILGLISFFTILSNQTRAWSIKKGTKIKEAGRTIHQDFEEKFIRTSVINWQKFLEAGSWQKAQQKGWLRTEGKEYLVQDGDMIEFKI